VFYGCDELRYVNVIQEYQDSEFCGKEICKLGDSCDVSSSSTIDISSTITHPSGSCGNSVNWELDVETGILTISGNGEMYDYWNNAPWYDYKGSIKTVVIESGVTSIGSWAFSYSYSLASVTIPNSVISIGEDAFEYCESLTSITIPNSVTSIGNFAFSSCLSLTSITIGNSVASIGNYAFHYCTSLTSVTIGNSVEEIGDGAFEYCTSLSSIIIPDSIKSIGNGAFYGCTLLSNVKFEGINDPGEDSYWVFNGCEQLEFVVVLPHYENKTFCEKEIHVFGDGSDSSSNDNSSNDSSSNDNSSNDSSSNDNSSNDSSSNDNSSNDSSSIESSSRTILSGSCGDNVNWQLDIEVGNLTISRSGKMNDYSFGYYSPWYNYRSLIKRIVIDSGVETIGNYAFYECSSLTSITIPSSILSVGSNAFYGCNSLNYNEYDNGHYLGNENNKYHVLIETKNKEISSCEINSKTVVIGDNAFYDCNSITSITIPDSVVSIGNKAFYNCILLTNVEYFGINNPGKNSHNVFDGCSKLPYVIVPLSYLDKDFCGKDIFENCERRQSWNPNKIECSECSNHCDDCSFNNNGIETCNKCEDGYEYVSDSQKCEVPSNQPSDSSSNGVVILALIFILALIL